jgi:hypothetical protein
MSYDIVGNHFTGLLVPAEKPSSFKAYEQNQPMLSISEIKRILADENRTPARKRFSAKLFIKNQGGRGSCNGYAGAWALARARIMAGLKFEALSGEYLYSMINGGRDSGSMLDDGMKALMEKGVALESLVQHESYLWSQMSESARQSANRFKAVECYTANTEIGLASGLALGFVGVVAVHATNSWMHLDANGISDPSRGPGNHAVCCQDVAVISDTLCFDIANSWGLSFGREGHAWNTWKNHLATPNQYHAFYLIRGCTDDPQHLPPTPKD